MYGPPVTSGLRPRFARRTLCAQQFKARNFANLATLFLCLAGMLQQAGSADAAGDEVDAAIVFAVDASFSMDPAAAGLQREGHAAALRSQEVQSAIAAGLIGCIAITYVEWSGVGNLHTVLPWTTVCDAAAATEAGDIISKQGDRAIGRRLRSRTSLSFALDASSLILDRFSGRTERKIIDISANGSNNDGLPVSESRERTLAKGHIVNAIVLSREEPDVEPDLPGYFSAMVAGGPGSFVIVPDEPSDYALAIRRKLVLEISGLDVSSVGGVSTIWN